MDEYKAGLRCQDVNSGLRTFDAASPRLAPLKKTRLVGMAADLASLVRGTPIVNDMPSLESVAAAELDVPSTSFDSVVALLETANLVELTRDKSGEVTGLTSNVPYFQDLYRALGSAWQGRGPSQLEQEIVAVVDHLAAGPLPTEMLVERTGIETADVELILQLGSDSNLIKSASGVDGTILYSPFMAFENPALLGELAEKHGSDQLLGEFDALKNRQGLAVTAETFPMLYDAVGRGLVLAPSVTLPTGGDQLFATLPYTLDRELLLGRKPVLDKALAVVACIRCGEDFGGYSDIPSAVNAINKLLRDGELNPHSSSARQYRLMRNKGVVAYGPDPMPWGKWIVPTLIDTPDNREALEIARDLVSLGEPMVGRQVDGGLDLLSTDAVYRNPMKTLATHRPKLGHREAEYSKIVAAVMGYGVA